MLEFNRGEVTEVKNSFCIADVHTKEMRSDATAFVLFCVASNK